jgi:glutamyl-tRNA synthetase
VTPPTVRARFAPAPTGYLHIGGARTALFNWLFARQQGGELVLRIEDTDAERTRRELIEVIYRALEWLGIDWDGEPVHQSDRADLYREAAEKLLAGGQAYWCDCTPDDVKARAEQRGGKPGYDGHCRSRELGPGEGRVVRFRTPDDGSTAFDDEIRGHISFENADLEDFVIVRSTGVPMFLLANAVDDADLGITHIIRGEDLINVTPKVLLLRRALGITAVPMFAHLPLIVNEKRQKLSKRRDDVSVGDYIERGYLPEAMRNYLATLGWGAPDGVEIRPVAEIIELFRLDQVNKASAFFDLKKLNNFNGEYIRALPVPEFVDRSTHWITGPDTPWPAERFEAKVFEQLAPLVQTRVDTLSEVPHYVDFAFVGEPTVDDMSWQKAMAKNPEQAVAMLDEATIAFADARWEGEALMTIIGDIGERLGTSKKARQLPVRVALTGRDKGIPLGEILEVLGRDESVRRLRAARARL